MKGHTPHMADLSGKKREVFRLRTRLIVSIILLFLVATTIIILLLSCYGN